jgi:hypothetical protein
VRGYHLLLALDRLILGPVSLLLSLQGITDKRASGCARGRSNRKPCTR